MARRARRGLIQVLTGPDTAPQWWRPPWQRRAYIAMSVTALALAVVNLASLHGQPSVTPTPPTACRASPCHYIHYVPPGIGQILLTVAVVVVPLLLAARYPLLGWRIGRASCRERV